MKTYNLQDLLKSPPQGATHILYTPFNYDYIYHDDTGYRVWLGIKHGGWSVKLQFQHPNYNKLIPLLATTEA